ncbi:Undecaprenyl-phosphate glucose phosphotransferase [Mobilisporobacter senegalensis]|uniref:Undecaprenyl-phosphate glucose phosphotransferase n=1 Tax=Mobilisporobacter senegalensis TaxID=1329262 RepID=A0A3N1XR38_9FIRM|nr:undecaprenyl-phosphate glucose phosphotransferase [Mobilisporobacter senegalensis]ROR28611.1 Undecaprenyl-phosphate glucose phosphotransferase [Mobilisporobacter senegalensis]
MIKDNQKMFNRLHVLLDGFIIVLSYAVAFELRFKYLNFLDFFRRSSVYYLPLHYVAKELIYLVPVYLIIYYFCNLYSPKRGSSRRFELWNLTRANALGVLFFMFVLYLTNRPDFSRKFIGVFFVVNIAFGYFFRNMLGNILRIIRRKGFNLKHILIVGYSRAAEYYIDRILANPQWGYYIHGVLDDNMEVGTSYKGVKIIGPNSNLSTMLLENTLDEIVIALNIGEYSKLECLVSTCEKFGVHTKFVPDYNNIIPTKPYTEDLNGLPVINIRNVPLTNTLNKCIKRIIDIFGAVVAIILFSIPMIIVSAIIKLTSSGPLIFSQVRVGLHNKEFKMYKFRSMAVQKDSEEKKAWTTFNDPRVTPIGKFIRKTSIDELPQLFNVLKGDMSLIGPRPERPFFVEKFKEEIPRYMIKHQVRPGLTGWAQVNGYRGDTSIRKRIDHDLYYIENWTLGLDIKILFMTFFKGFVNKNAY